MERNQRTGKIAEALGLSPASVQAYARAGRIPYRKTPGAQYRFNLEEVRDVLGLSDIQARDDLVSVFSADTAVVVDTLSAYRDEPQGEVSLRRDRIRGVRPRRSLAMSEVAPDAGGSELAQLVKAGHGAAVAVVHREYVDA